MAHYFGVSPLSCACFSFRNTLIQNLLQSRLSYWLYLTSIFFTTISNSSSSTSMKLLMNKLFRLHRKFPKIDYTTTKVLKPFFPFTVYVFKTYYELDWILAEPLLHGLEVFYILMFISIEGSIHYWFRVTRQCQLNRLQTITYTFMEIEDFIRFV